MNTIINNLASEYRPTKDNSGTSISDQSTTVGAASAAMLGTAVNATTNAVFWDLQDAGGYVTFDGSAPVAGSNGHFIAKNSSGIWSPSMVTDAKWIRESATSGRLHISEFQSR